MRSGVANRATIVIPTISERRNSFLPLAIQSVLKQIEPTDVVVETDRGFDQNNGYRVGGAAETRNRGIEQVETEWTGFLDDDDELYPQHVSECLRKADATDADLVYPWWDGANEDWFRVPYQGQQVSPEGIEFGPELRKYLLGEFEWVDGRDGSNYLPITVLVKTELLKEVGGFPVPGTPDWPHRLGEDHGLWIRLLKAGAKFVHLHERTWLYRLHGQQSGALLYP